MTPAETGPLISILEEVGFASGLLLLLSYAVRTLGPVLKEFLAKQQETLKTISASIAQIVALTERMDARLVAIEEDIEELYTAVGVEKPRRRRRSPAKSPEEA